MLSFWGAKGAPILFSEIGFCVASCSYIYIYTVWPEILAGRYFGGLLKICHLAEFTLAVEPVFMERRLGQKSQGLRAIK